MSVIYNALDGATLQKKNFPLTYDTEVKAYCCAFMLSFLMQDFNFVIEYYNI